MPSAPAALPMAMSAAKIARAVLAHEQHDVTADVAHGDRERQEPASAPAFSAPSTIFSAAESGMLV
jgi:hypothetical protein